MNAVEKIPAVGRELRASPGPLDIVQAAMKSGNVEMYREAVALYKELEGMAARKAFDNAMADAKAIIPVIRKDRRVGFESKKAGATRTDYAHESLAEIARTVDPILGRHGISYRFRVTSNPNEPVTVTCVLSHRDGHFEETTLRAGRDDSGNKNAIQQIGSTITYLQRYTLKAALGLAASEDDDGRASELGDDADDLNVTAAEAEHLRHLLKATGCPEANFLTAAKRERIEDIPAANYDRCVKLINSYRGPRQ